MSGSSSRLNGYVTWKWLLTTLMAMVAMLAGMGSFVLEAHAATVHAGAATRVELESCEMIALERYQALIKRLDRIESKLDRR